MSALLRRSKPEIVTNEVCWQSVQWQAAYVMLVRTGIGLREETRSHQSATSASRPRR